MALNSVFAKYDSQQGKSLDIVTQNFDTVPLCTRPWLMGGLAWDKFAVCGNSYKYDFGQIKEFPKDTDYQKEIFNHENYIKRRELLGTGRRADTCANCSNYANNGALNQMLARDVDILSRIEDLGQRLRASENFEMALSSAAKKETVVNHYPAYIGISCGSACNLKCQICYNRNMDYHPDPIDILNIIDKIHNTLAYVILSGGEPQITKAGRALLEQFATGKYKFAVRMFTNAAWADFGLLRPVNLADVVISTDGATKKIYEMMREGGDFGNLISNIKKFVEMQKEKPYMKLTTNFVVTSDNYMDIPEAVKLYESFGLYTMFAAVSTSERYDPKNFKERPDLYEDILKKVDEGINLTTNPFTIEKLEAIKNAIFQKMDEAKNKKETSQEEEHLQEQVNKKSFISYVTKPLFSESKLCTYLLCA